MRQFAPLLLLGLVAAAFVAGRELRGEMAIEYSADSIRAYVLELGVAAPLIFVGMMSFRQFLLLPSGLVLTAGGLVFGVPVGTVLGALGLLISGTIGFGVARGMGRERVQAYLARRFPVFEKRMQRAGLAMVALVTAHPMGVMTPFHWGAGVTSIRLWAFACVLAAGGLVRAFTYSFFGASLIEPGGQIYLAMGLLAVVALAPLAHPAVRRRLLR